jgi:HAD superfamily hydrolase (TIGR01509 family)
MIRVVILDVDGTLLDTNYLHVEAWARALQTVNRQVPRAVIHRQIGKGSKYFLDELVDNASIHPQVSELHRQYYEAIQHEGYPLPGAKELIAHLSSQDIAVWLATSAKPEVAKDHASLLDAQDHISGTVSSGDVERPKPAPDIFQHTLSKAGGSPHETLVVGDTIWDIQAADACGLRTIAVMTGGAFSRQEFEKAGAVAVYQDCAELLASGFLRTFVNGSQPSRPN